MPSRSARAILSLPSIRSDDAYRLANRTQRDDTPGVLRFFCTRYVRKHFPPRINICRLRAQVSLDFRARTADLDLYALSATAVLLTKWTKPSQISFEHPNTKFNKNPYVVFSSCYTRTDGQTDRPILCLNIMFEFPCIITLYYIKNQRDATLAVLFISNCKITLHVSDAFCVHHQE